MCGRRGGGDGGVDATAVGGERVFVCVCVCGGEGVYNCKCIFIKYYRKTSAVDSLRGKLSINL